MMSIIRAVVAVLCAVSIMSCSHANSVEQVVMAKVVEENSVDSKVLYNFKLKKNLDDWLIVNDGVMGGLSKSRLFLQRKVGAVFTGEVSLDNNGGFASTRTSPLDFNLNGLSAIELRVKGDGKKYQFRIRADGEFDGPSYRHHFDTKKGQWMTIVLPLVDFVPTFRGRVISRMPVLSSEKIRQLGFLISDSQEGEFSLVIESIKAY